MTGAIPTSEGAFQPSPTAGDHHFGHTLHNATNIKHGCPEKSAKSLVAVAKMAAILSGVMVTSTVFFRAWSVKQEFPLYRNFFRVEGQARIPSLPYFLEREEKHVKQPDHQMVSWEAWKAWRLDSGVLSQRRTSRYIGSSGPFGNLGRN